MDGAVTLRPLSAFMLCYGIVLPRLDLLKKKFSFQIFGKKNL